MEINKGPGASPLINPVSKDASHRVLVAERRVTHGLRTTHLHKIKAGQQRDAVFGRLLLGLVLGGRHLGGGPLAACGRIGTRPSVDLLGGISIFPLENLLVNAPRWGSCLLYVTIQQ